MKRIVELDALRGLAAAAIVAFHLWFPGRPILGTAVDLFFVLSGYLITGIILRRMDDPGFLGHFYFRRALRIWPIYYLSLLALVLIHQVAPGMVPIEGLGYFLTYTQNVPNYWRSPGPHFFSGFQHTWTLALEEQFYILWPIALVALGRRSVVPLALALIAAAIAARAGGVSRWVLLTRCDGLALGGLLAVSLGSTAPGRVDPRRWLGAVAAGSACYLAVAGRLSATWGVPADLALSLRMFAINALYAGAIGLVVVGSGSRWLLPLRDARLAWLGRLSYGLYLYHYIIVGLVDGVADRNGIAHGLGLDAVKLAASLGAAAASWHFLELPLLNHDFGAAARAREAAGPVALGLAASAPGSGAR